MQLEDPRFRITVWPEATVQEVPVHRAVRPDLHPDGSIAWSHAAASPQVLPDEFVLRDLADLDLNDVEAVLALLTVYGPIQRREDPFGWADEGFYPASTGFLFNPPPHLAHYFDHDQPQPRDLPDGTTGHQLVRPYWEADEFEPPLAAQSPGLVDDSAWNRLDDVVGYLSTLKSMVSHWLNHLEDRPVEDAWPLGDGGSTGAGCWEDFARALTLGLAEYRMRVEFHFHDRAEQDVTIDGPIPDLYSAACLQLFNLMTENLPVRHCQNETCGRRFFRQLGGAKYGQHRTEGQLLYCSRNCAKAQVQRVYRRRAKEKKAND